MSIKQYRADGVTPIDGLVLTGVQTGTESDVALVIMENEGAAELTSVPIVQRTEDPLDPGTGLASGVPPQDEMWGRLRIAGFDASGSDDPSWTVDTTDFLPAGAYSGLVVDRWPVGGRITFEYKVRPPQGAKDAATWGLYLQDLSGLSTPTPPALTKVDRGILHGLGDGTVSYVLRDLDVVASDTPDDQVHTQAGQAVVSGHLVGVTEESHTLDQSDGSAEALTSGESYLVIRSLQPDGTVTLTKGDKGADPDVPSTPAGELRLPRVIRVEFQSGGVSIIESADIEGDAIYGRYFCEVDSATTLKVHPGSALGGGSHRFADETQLVPLPDDDESWIWQLASGLFEDTQDPLVRPEDTAIGPFWRALAAGGAISELEDLRAVAGQTVVLHLEGTPTADATPDKLDSVIIGHERLILEQVIARISDNGSGAAGSTILDTEIGAPGSLATIYTSQGTDDQRPTFAFDAATLIDDDGVHELVELRQGQELALFGDAYPDTDGSPPATAEAWYICRRV